MHRRPAHHTTTTVLADALSIRMPLMHRPTCMAPLQARLATCCICDLVVAVAAIALHHCSESRS